jgi:ribose transport system substrate-binding protein
MSKFRLVVSLVTADNDFQMEQAEAARRVATNLGADVEILFADGDAVNQSQQLLNIIQGPATSRPDAILIEPAGSTGLPQVAAAAVSAGMAWVVLNHDADYFAKLRNHPQAMVFGVGSNHKEVGKIQGQQMRSLLPKGGSALFIQGPSGSVVSRYRAEGMYESKPDNIEVKQLRSASWSEAGGHKAVTAWLRLSTAHSTQIDLVACQNDAIAMGARKAFEENTSGKEREARLRLPFLGVDGVPKTGQDWVRRGLLRATVIIPPNTARAIEMLIPSLKNKTRPPELSLIPGSSFPDLKYLSPVTQ